jgi:hypothetical protein
VRLRRKHLPVELEECFETFDAVLAEVEPAKAALAAVMPTTRLPGLPLPDAVMEFEERIERAIEVMPGWRRPETEVVWGACDAGLAEALARSRRLRDEAPELGGFEGLIWAVEQLMSPLDPFEAAAERFRALRTVRPEG